MIVRPPAKYDVISDFAASRPRRTAAALSRLSQTKRRGGRGRSADREGSRPRSPGGRALDHRAQADAARRDGTAHLGFVAVDLRGVYVAVPQLQPGAHGIGPLRATIDDDDPGIIRVDFPGYSGKGTLEKITWEEWFEKFEESGLAFLHRDLEHKDGELDRFNKLVKRGKDD